MHEQHFEIAESPRGSKLLEDVGAGPKVTYLARETAS